MNSPFPILFNYGFDSSNAKFKSIPWEAIQPYEPQALLNHGQTLSRLAERGGLCPQEALLVLTEKPLSCWRIIPTDVALNELHDLLKSRGFANSVTLEETP